MNQSSISHIKSFFLFLIYRIFIEEYQTHVHWAHGQENQWMINCLIISDLEVICQIILQSNTVHIKVVYKCHIFDGIISYNKQAQIPPYQLINNFNSFYRSKDRFYEWKFQRWFLRTIRFNISQNKGIFWVLRMTHDDWIW